jgi:hypothetical protein
LVGNRCLVEDLEGFAIIVFDAVAGVYQ